MHAREGGLVTIDSENAYRKQYQHLFMRTGVQAVPLGVASASKHEIEEEDIMQRASAWGRIQRVRRSWVGITEPVPSLQSLGEGRASRTRDTSSRGCLVCSKLSR